MRREIELRNRADLSNCFGMIKRDNNCFERTLKRHMNHVIIIIILLFRVCFLIFFSTKILVVSIALYFRFLVLPKCFVCNT